MTRWLFRSDGEEFGAMAWPAEVDMGAWDHLGKLDERRTGG